MMSHQEFDSVIIVDAAHIFGHRRLDTADGHRWFHYFYDICSGRNIVIITCRFFDDISR